MKKNKPDKIENLRESIEEFGGDILSSPIFGSGYDQIHHLKTSVGEHSLRVAELGIEICDFLERRGVKVDKRKVVRTALLHDLGMLGRKKMYRNNFECGRMHPGNSAIIAGKIWKDIDKDSLDAIKSHMWPLSSSMPRTREAVVLCLADKLASVKDIVNRREKNE